MIETLKQSAELWAFLISMVPVIELRGALPIALASGVNLPVAVLLTVALSAVIYALMLIVLKALPKEDVLMLPKGKKIAALLKLD